MKGLTDFVSLFLKHSPQYKTKWAIYNMNKKIHLLVLFQIHYIKNIFK